MSTASRPLRHGLVLGTALLTLAACGGTTPMPDTAAAAPVARSGTGAAAVPVSLADCGSTWRPIAGDHQVVLHNVDTRSGEVRVVARGGPHAGAVYADVEPLGPGTTVSVPVDLPAGRFALECLMDSEPAVAGPTVRVVGSAHGRPGVVPVDAPRLAGAARAYTTWVRGRLPALLAHTRDLQRAIDDRDVTAARSAWLAGHVGYETLGAAYDAFGPLDAAINGRSAGLPGGVHDPGFTGFHRVESLLWPAAPSGAGWTALATSSALLTRDIAGLRHQLATTPPDPLTISIRAHEITENLIQVTLTGEDDDGSHSALATLAAGLDGTREVLSLVVPLLRTRYAALPALQRELAGDRRLVAGLLTTPLAHEAVADWPMERREAVDAALSGLVEKLAPIAAELEPRRTS